MSVFSENTNSTIGGYYYDSDSDSGSGSDDNFQQNAGYYSHKGGNLISGITDLAIPFAILLAKQGIQDFLRKNNIGYEDSQSTNNDYYQDNKPMSGGYYKKNDDMDAFAKALQEVRKKCNCDCNNGNNK